MFTVSSVHARDYSLGCSIAGVQNRSQGIQEGLTGCRAVPSVTWRPSGRTRSFSCTIYL